MTSTTVAGTEACRFAVAGTLEVIRRRLRVMADKGLDSAGEGNHLLFFIRNNTPLSMNNVCRTLCKMLADAGLSHLDVSPHTAPAIHWHALAPRDSLDVA